MEEFVFRPASHAAFSSNLAAPDFYPFGTIKARLRARSFEVSGEPVEAVRGAISYLGTTGWQKGGRK
jgi:hypothetical protein